MKVDTGNPNIVPTITIDDMDKLAAEEPLSPLQQQPPGAMPAGPAPPIPDWYKVGWRAVGGIDAPELEGDPKELAILSTFLHEQFYGDWYHNAALIVFVRVFLMYPMYTIPVNPKFILSFPISGCIRFPFCNPLWFWLGMALRHPRSWVDHRFRLLRSCPVVLDPRGLLHWMHSDVLGGTGWVRT